MEESETPKTWFILHDGERFGPFSMDDLKLGVETHEINPRLDMAWQEGMDDWIIAGEIEGLFEKNTKAEAVEKKDMARPTSNESTLKASEFEDESPDDDDDGEWEGVSRGGFFFFCYIFPIIWMVGLFYGSKMLKGFVGDDIMPLVVGCLSLLPFLIAIFAILQRFQNLAMSRLWFFGLLVPLLNLWLGYRLFACPPGYAERKKLGFLGWILAVIYWLPVLAAIGIGVMIAIKGPAMIEDLIEKIAPNTRSSCRRSRKPQKLPRKRRQEKPSKRPRKKRPKARPSYLFTSDPYHETNRRASPGGEARCESFRRSRGVH